MSGYLLTPEEQVTLGWALKATGRTAHDIDDRGAWFKDENDPIVGAWSKFNSFTSDADAFRLAAQLRLLCAFSEDGIEARVDAYTGNHWIEFCERDACAAMRHAITMCAALVGGYKP